MVFWGVLLENVNSQQRPVNHKTRSLWHLGFTTGKIIYFPDDQGQVPILYEVIKETVKKKKTHKIPPHAYLSHLQSFLQTQTI